EAVEQRPVPAALLREPTPRRLDDGGKLPKRAGKLLINNNIFEPAGLGQFGSRRLDTLLDDFGAVLSAAFQAAAQLLDRRRGDEHQHRIGELAPHLHGALPVDLQDDVLAGGHPLLDPGPGGGIEVVVHLRPFEEVARVAPADEFVAVEELVVHAVHLARAGRARRAGHRKPEVGQLAEEGAHQRGLAGARGRGDHEQAAGLGSGAHRGCLSSVGYLTNRLAGWTGEEASALPGRRTGTGTDERHRGPPPWKGDRSTTRECASCRTASTGAGSPTRSSAIAATRRSGTATAS